MRSLLMIVLALAALLGSGSARAKDGVITVKEVDGRWWFFNAEGKRFFFLGPDCVAGCYGHVEEKPLTPWKHEQARKVLKDQKFNAVGNWSSPSMWDEFYFTDQVYHGVESIVDYFDEPTWVPGMRKQVVIEMKAFANKKNLVGLFLDNERHWKDDEVFAFFRALPRKAPGAKLFVDFFKKRFNNDIKALNKHWGSSLASFDDLIGKKTVTGPATKLDKKAWTAVCAGRFYEAIAREVRAVDPHHLLVGVRHAGFPGLGGDAGPDLDLIEAINKSMDVISVNDYNRFGELRPEYGAIYERCRKPIMITEWSFSGFPTHGLKSLQYIDVYNQADRGRGYTKYTREMAQAPFMVGSQWFLYADYDWNAIMRGPYYPDENMGLVSADEKTVYKEFGDWVRKANGQVEAWHAAAKWAPKPSTAPQAGVFPSFTPKLDGDLSEWPADTARVPRIARSLFEGVQVKDRYHVSIDAKFLYVAATIHDDRVDTNEPAWNWECDYFGVTVKPAGSMDERERSYFAVLPAGGGNPAGVGPDPYVMSWASKAGYGPLASGKVSRKLREDGTYSLEAAIPLKDLATFDKSVPVWNVRLFYHNNSGVYETDWEGLLKR